MECWNSIQVASGERETQELNFIKENQKDLGFYGMMILVGEHCSFRTIKGGRIRGSIQELAFVSSQGLG